MAFALDYSAGRPSAAAVKAAGYAGVVRYIGFPANPKCITKAEYDDMIAHGVGVALVYEQTAGDALNGRVAGNRAAGIARAHANAIRFPPTRPIYYACDTDVVSGQFTAVLEYLHGAAESEGSAHRVGVYGEYDVVQAAAKAAAAFWFWQTRAWSHGLVHDRAHLRQELGQVTVGGIECDRNTILAPDWGQAGANQEADMPLSDDDVVKVTTAVWAKVAAGLSDGTHFYLPPLHTRLTALEKTTAGLQTATAQLVAAGRSDPAELLPAAVQAAVEAAVGRTVGLMAAAVVNHA